MNLARAIEYFLAAKKAKGLTPMSITTYSNRLYRFAKAMPEVETVEDIDKYSIERYIGMMQADPATRDVTVTSAARALSAFCSWLYEDDLIRVNPFKSEKRRVRVPKAPRPHIEVIPDADFWTLVRSCDRDTEKGRRDEAMLLFLMDTGVRVSELVGLTKDRLDMKSRRADVLGKGRKWRSVFFSTQTAVALTRYLSRRRDGSDHVFLGHSDRGMTVWGVNQMLERRKAKTGVTSRVNPHNFRHTFATNFLKAGGGVPQVQRILGHTDPALVLRTYTHLVDDDIRDAHDQFSPVARMSGRR